MFDQALTNIELAVVALARNDPPSSLAQRRRLCRQIFGSDVDQKLASPRLEALRRYAILRRVHGTTLSETERGRLREKRFEDLHISEIGRPMSAQYPTLSSS